MPANSLPAWLAAAFETHGGWLSLHDYMDLCLYHPKHGYYTNGLNFLPRTSNLKPQTSDFITAPTLTPLFASCIARWLVAAWRRLGSPPSFTLAEAGPGDGSLMAQLLTLLRSSDPPLSAAVHPLLVEVSPRLRTLQQHHLAGFDVAWATHLPPAADPQKPLILLANELLDAFPVHQYEYRNNKWLERGFNAKLEAESRPANPALPSAPEGALRETSPTQTAWLQTLRRTAAAALIIDYGYNSLPPQGGDTLQALHRHQPVPITHQPGQSDLTAHVNFAHVIATLGPGAGLTDLAPFLLQNGLLAAAEPTISQPATAAALHRLLHPSRMGALFKVVEYFPH
jgi:SAM-dependent MidA family methyltransferase